MDDFAHASDQVIHQELARLSQTITGLKYRLARQGRKLDRTAEVGLLHARLAKLTRLRDTLKLAYMKSHGRRTFSSRLASVGGAGASSAERLFAFRRACRINATKRQPEMSDVSSSASSSSSSSSPPPIADAAC